MNTPKHSPITFRLSAIISNADSLILLPSTALSTGAAAAACDLANKNCVRLFLTPLMRPRVLGLSITYISIDSDLFFNVHTAILAQADTAKALFATLAMSAHAFGCR